MHFISNLHSHIASSIVPCSRNLPNPESCIVAMSEKLRPLLARGDLGDGFLTPPLEPLALDNIRMSRGQEFNAVFSKLQVNGPSKFVVDKLK